MLSVNSESLIRFTAEKIISADEADKASAKEFLDLLLDQDETQTLHLLEAQLKRDSNPERRRGYVLALKEPLSPSEIIILIRALPNVQDPTVL